METRMMSYLILLCTILFMDLAVAVLRCHFGIWESETHKTLVNHLILIVLFYNLIVKDICNLP